MSKRKENDGKIIVGVSIGDINGIGPEVVIKTFMEPMMLDICTPIVYASVKLTANHRKLLGIVDFSFHAINDSDDFNPKRANVVNVWQEDAEVQIGKSTDAAGKYAYLSLEAAVKDLASNKIDVLVTAPINKKNMQSAGFKFPGHTEYLTNYANVQHSLMILVKDKLRVATVTGHIALKEVALKLNTDLITEKIKVFNKSLIQDFNIVKPKIAVLGLNPHASDNGLMGSEEKEIIIPAIKKANQEGILAFGPFPSDGLFGSALYNFDGVLAMYHDQGLTPFKALAFDDGVNYTAGLPIVRTSPDHGTAYDIAGKNIASPNSFRNAVYLAIDIYKNRKLYKEMSANPLEIGKIKI